MIKFSLQKLSTIALLILVCSSGFSQPHPQSQSRHYNVIDYPDWPAKVCDMRQVVEETSGIIFFAGHVWTFNDSGGEPVIYCIDSKTGGVLRTVKIANATNFDWEDIAMDDHYIYIGDFGNNWGMRKNLVIYKILQKDIQDGKSEVNAEMIYFSFGDQQSFKKMNRNHNFDCESMSCYGDSLILFSKNWADHKTRMYKLSNNPGHYTLLPLDSFNADGLVTGASYCAKNNKLALIGYHNFLPFIFIVNDFNGRNFTMANITRINFPKILKSQTEGICWMDEKSLIISTEQTKLFNQAIYKVYIEDLLNQGENK